MDSSCQDISNDCNHTQNRDLDQKIQPPKVFSGSHGQIHLTSMWHPHGTFSLMSSDMELMWHLPNPLFIYIYIYIYTHTLSVIVGIYSSGALNIRS
jgi:hypothetical protein